MNITLSADAALIKKGREYARAHHTSLNQLVRDYLYSITGGNSTKKSADEFQRLANTMAGCSENEFNFSREAIYDRHSDR